MKRAQKREYNKLEAVKEKEQTLAKVPEALALEQKLQGKGKKRKRVNEDGTVEWQWFSERKR